MTREHSLQSRRRFYLDKGTGYRIDVTESVERERAELREAQYENERLRKALRKFAPKQCETDGGCRWNRPCPQCADYYAVQEILCDCNPERNENCENCYDTT